MGGTAPRRIARVPVNQRDQGGFGGAGENTISPRGLPSRAVWMCSPRRIRDAGSGS
jgi:hypothetical protein